jgi:hypothetical protein
MKIDGIGKQQAVEGNAEVGKKNRVRPEDGFANLLQDEISGATETETDHVESLNNIQNLLGIGMMPSDTELSGPISALEDTLTQLDSLKGQLETSPTPKQTDGIISRINSEVAGLQDKLSSLPEEHPLKEMAEELNVMAYMESVKWKRGDYM